MSNRANQKQALTLHQRIAASLEELPPSAGVLGTRTAVLRAADAALARLEVPVLQKLCREAKVLVQAMRRSAKPLGAERRRATKIPPTLGAKVAHTVPRSGRSSSWRKPEHAPIRYPYGEAPHGWDTRLHDTIESMPDSKSSAECLAKWKASRRSRAEQRGEEAEARQRHGRVRYHGPDEPPEWYWPPDPD